MFGYRLDRATMGVGIVGLLVVVGVYLVMIDAPFRRRSVGFLLSVLVLLTLVMFMLAITRTDESDGTE
ncbi:MAG: hypothetical protein SVG88_03350 [Halobacteriales archaeon]|nr:hypothetical protein [Halobacteriales archaeon]